jgi:hypothetical protein
MAFSTSSLLFVSTLVYKRATLKTSLAVKGERIFSAPANLSGTPNFERHTGGEFSAD